MTSVTLNNGLEMPTVGLGTWKLGPSEVEQAVKDAIDVGYRHFDCAYLYQNEKEVGDALKQKIEEGVVKREDLFITGKLWNTSHNPELVMTTLQNTLRDLSMEYLDLYLIHTPLSYKTGDNPFPVGDDGLFIEEYYDLVDTWKAMEECVNAGLTKSIGISNFNSEQVERILEHATIKPVINQVEAHPYLPQNKLNSFCKERGIILTAYSLLGSGDRPWAKPEDPVLLKEEKVLQIAEKLNKSPAQILIRYQIEKGMTVVPKSVNKQRLIDNLNVFDFTLSDEQIESLDSLDCNVRFLTFAGAEHFHDYPHHIEF